MKFDIDKIDIKNVAPNINTITHDNKTIRLWTCKLLLPFGLEDEYGKKIIKLELEENNNEHMQLKKIIEYLEKLIKRKMNVEDDEFKSVIRKRPSRKDMLEVRIKVMKNNILTEVEYEDKITNYLKTIYDLPKQYYIKVQLEINGFWDYRTEQKDKNKCGLVIYATKIIV